MENIFTTLYKYKPQPEITPAENFFTESLKIVLSSDSELLNKFVKYISGDLVFRAPFILESQVRYGNSIIDLQVTDKNYKKIFIEIKVNAHENRYYDEDTADDFGQVEKYLRMDKGYVCFIAKDQGNIEIKTNADKFLGQYEWFEIYRLISNYLHNNKLNKSKKYFITNFLNFMKDLDMQPFNGFNKSDLILSQTNFLEFNEKILDFLTEVYKDKRIATFLKKHKLIIRNGKPCFSSAYKLYNLDFYQKNWSWFKRIRLGFSLYTLGGEYKIGLWYCQGVSIWKSNLRERIKGNFRQLKINKKFFNKTLDDNYSQLYKEIYFTEFIKPGKEQQAITYIYNSLLELEKSGVMDVLKKLR